MYLPSFAQMLTSVAEGKRKPLISAHGLALWLLEFLVNCAEPVVFRFAREHAEDARQLFLSAVRWSGEIDQKCPEFAVVRSPGRVRRTNFVATIKLTASPLGRYRRVLPLQKPSFCLLLATGLDSLLGALVACSLPVCAFSSLPGLELRPRTGVRAILERHMASDDPEPLSLLAEFSELTTLQTFDLVPVRAGLISDGVDWPYWTCETSRTATTGLISCALQNEGEEMSMCGQVSI